MVILMLILYGSLCVVSACVIGAACVVSQRAPHRLPLHLAKGYPHSRPSTLHPTGPPKPARRPGRADRTAVTLSTNSRPNLRPAPLSEQTLELLTLTVLYGCGGQAPWATVRQATQALVNAFFPERACYPLGPALTQTRDRLPAKGKIVYGGPGAQVALR